MAKLNTNFRFSEKRAVTVPVVRIPRKVKDALNIAAVHENGIFKIEPMDGMAVYDQCYIFEDINYKNQDEGKKTYTLLEIMKWFKGMSTQFKVTIANEQRDMEKFMEETFRPLHGEEYPDLEQGLGDWINQKIEEGTRDIRRVLYLTVTCRAKSFEEAAVFFSTLDTSLQTIFSALRSRLYRMSGRERLTVLQRMLRLGENGVLPQPARISSGNDSWKNQILPVVMEQDMDFMRLNTRYACVLFAHDYDQSLDEEKVVHGLTDTLFPTYITLDIEPVKRRLLKEKLLSAHTNNERNISQERERSFMMGQYGAGTSYLLNKKKEELEGMLNQVDENDEEAVFLGMLVLVPADTLEELAQRVDTLKQIANTNGYKLDPYYHRQLKALNTVLPIGGRQVNHMHSLFTSSAVAFQPFYARDLQDKGAYVYGLNRTTKHLLRGNRKRLKAPHGMIVGHTGSGKSFLIKETEIAQTLLFTDDDVIILDPNNEQEEFIKTCRGQYFDFTPQCQIYLNPFEIPMDVWEGDLVIRNRFIAKKTEYAISFCTAVMTNILVTQIHMNYIGRAVRKVYEECFGQKKRKRNPTLIDIWENLKEQTEKAESPEERRMLLDIVDSLEEYTVGVYDMFAHPSNLNIHNRLVGFGLKNIPESVWEPVMVTLMHFLAIRIEYNQDKLIASRLVVDETQVLCEKGSSASQLLYAVETYRKVGAVVTLAIQNLTRALENPELRDMFSNCPYKCFLDQGGVDAANLARIQELSQEEFRALEENIPGHGVMVWDTQVYLFDARMKEENVLYPQFNTDFHEKAEKQRKESEGKKKEMPQDTVEDHILSLLEVCVMNHEEMLRLPNYPQEEIENALEDLLHAGRIAMNGNVYESVKG